MSEIKWKMFKVMHESKCCMLKMSPNSLNPLKAQYYVNVDSGLE